MPGISAIFLSNRSVVRTVKELGSDLVSIAEFLEETSVLGNTLDTKRLVLAPNGVDEVVVRDGDRSGGASDVTEV